MQDKLTLFIKAALYECISPNHIRLLIDNLSEIVSSAQEDLEAFASKDPSSSKDLNVILQTSTSFQATMHYRIANWLSKQKVNIPEKTLELYCLLISQRGKLKSGAEIHFRCSIGKRFVLDHGWGTVFGETVSIGDDCYVLGGVVLGARGIANNPKTVRHPQIGNNVQIGSFSQVLGNISIGDNAFIGTHCIVVNDVPPDTKMINKNLFV